MANMKIPAGDSENEFNVDEQQEWSPMSTSDGGRRRATKVLKVESEEQPKDDKEGEDIEEEVEVPEDDEEEKELNQGPNSKPTKKFKTEGFVVLKTDIIDKEFPLLWKIDENELLRKYVPFKMDSKVLYKSTIYYDVWCPCVEHKYYSAPVSSIYQTNTEHFVRFHKDKIKKVP